MNTKEIIKFLKQQGFETKISHRRYSENGNYFCTVRDMPDEEHVKPLGGETHVTITNGWNKSQYKGIAVCSKKDNFCKAFGVDLALTRAFKTFLNQRLTGRK